MAHQEQGELSSASRSQRHPLLSIAGGGVAVAAVLAHLGGGALVMHVGLPAALVYLGLGGTLGSFSGSALVIGIVMIAAIAPMVIFGARHWLRHR
jgi:hypothetical protein